MKALVTIAVVAATILFSSSECSAQVDFRSRKPEKLRHMPEVTQCALCHSASKPMLLNMLDGALIAYGESTKLCAQCHGERFSEWERGIHGKQKGGWQKSQSEKIGCVACHDPHSPRFEQMAPTAPPKHPKFLIRKHEETLSHE